MGLVESKRPVVLIVEDEFLLRMEAAEGGRFLPKPYSPTEVTGVLRELIGGP